MKNQAPPTTAFLRKAAGEKKTVRKPSKNRMKTVKSLSGPREAPSESQSFDFLVWHLPPPPSFEKRRGKKKRFENRQKTVWKPSKACPGQGRLNEILQVPGGAIVFRRFSSTFTNFNWFSQFFHFSWIFIDYSFIFIGFHWFSFDFHRIFIVSSRIFIDFQLLFIDFHWFSINLISLFSIIFIGFHGFSWIFFDFPQISSIFTNFHWILTDFQSQQGRHTAGSSLAAARHTAGGSPTEAPRLATISLGASLGRQGGRRHEKTSKNSSRANAVWGKTVWKPWPPKKKTTVFSRFFIWGIVANPEKKNRGKTVKRFFPRTKVCIHMEI